LEFGDHSSEIGPDLLVGGTLLPGTLADCEIHFPKELRSQFVQCKAFALKALPHPFYRYKSIERLQER
jgi:hypothetical protein